jgi:hypothetical protein
MKQQKRSIAEEKFAKTQKKREIAASDKDKALKARAVHTAELKERRLAREAENKLLAGLSGRGRK